LNFDKILRLLAAAAAIVAAAVVVVVAASFAVYAAAKPYVGEAWAAAIVAGVFALIAVVLAASLTAKARPKPQRAEDQSLTTRLIELARDKPIVAAGAAVAGAIVLARNPKIVTTILSAAVAGRAAAGPRPSDKRR
jgi:flagellar biosynthesis component FlhA